VKSLCIIGKLAIGGSEKIAICLANEMNKRGFGVKCCIREDGDLRNTLEGDEPIVIARKGLFDLNYLWEICRLIRDLNVDVIHGHMIGSGSYALIAAKLTGKKFLYTIHGNTVFNNWHSYLLLKVVVRFADKIVTVSDQLYNRSIKEFKSGRRKICTIENGINLAIFDRPIDMEQKRHELHIPTDSQLVGAVGSIKYVKGYDVLIHAFKDVLTTMANVKLLIVGDADTIADRNFKKRLEGMILEYGLTDSIMLLGCRRDVYAIMSLLDIFVLPSRSEGTCLALLEAMASRKPIVATDVGGTPYVLGHNESGLLVPAEQPKALTQAMLTLLNDKELAMQLGDNAKEVVETRFSLNAMVSQYSDLYRDITSP